jgi:PKHD-type hydroxylase
MAHLFWQDEGGLSKKECEHILKEYENVGLEAGITDNKASISVKQRQADIHWVKNNNLLTRSLFQYALDANDLKFRYTLFNYEKSGEYDQIQFTRYNEGCFYDWHVDFYEISKNGSNRKLSLIVNLSDPKDYDGGDLEFFEGEEPPFSPAKRKQGSIVVFDSFDWHRVTPVTRGTRYSLVLWVWGPELK